MDFVDTHCHIQDAQLHDDPHDAVQKKWHQAGNPRPADIIKEAAHHGVTRLICVGCTTGESQRAVSLAAVEPNVWASIGIHPHEAQAHLDEPEMLETFKELVKEPRIVAIGECGLDYFYHHSPPEAQKKILHFQLELAQKYQLPVIFHVREAFEDFWPIFDEYRGIRGVIHSFTATTKELQEILKRGLYVGLNGIMTFTKNTEQLEAAKAVPLERMLLETDAPFLTPEPHRGSIGVPKHVRTTGEFLAELRGESLATLAAKTTHNAQLLFDIE